MLTRDEKIALVAKLDAYEDAQMAMQRRLVAHGGVKPGEECAEEKAIIATYKALTAYIDGIA